MPWQHSCQMPWSTRLKTSTCQKLRLVPTTEQPFLVASCQMLNPSGFKQWGCWHSKCWYSLWAYDSARCEGNTKTGHKVSSFALFLKRLNLSQDLPHVSTWQTQVPNPSHLLWVQLPLCFEHHTKKNWTESHPIPRRWQSCLPKRCLSFCLVFSIRKLSCSRTSVLSSHKRYGEDFGLFRLNEDKVMHLILRILYTNTAKFEYIHEPLPQKLLQPFHQKIFSGRCFQRRTSHRNTIWQIWPGTMSFLKSMISSYRRLKTCKSLSIP